MNNHKSKQNDANIHLRGIEHGNKELDFRHKEVINSTDARRLGYVTRRLCRFIKCIGDDLILVEI